MWTCERFGFVVGLLAAVVAATGCGAVGAEGADCFRFSDCAQGLTCAYGRCAVPPAPDPSDGGGGQADDGGVLGLESGATGDDGASIGFEAGPQGDDGATAE